MTLVVYLGLALCSSNNESSNSSSSDSPCGYC